MTSAPARRYDIPAFTEGWFQIAWSKDLRRGELKKVHQFGREYTLFRGEDGTVGVIDDVCPHLGAHFSEGGCVKGNSVQCPYHAWEFDRTGACTGIAYAKKIPRRARVAAYTVVEKYGLIFMYRDKEGTAPDKDLPPIYDFDPSEYLDPKTFEFRIRIHGQDIMENSVDSPHFWAVHGHAMPTNKFFRERDELRVDQVSSVHRFGTELNFKIEFHLVEPGFHYLHFPTLPGGARAFVFSSIVPVDDEYTNHRLTVMMKKTSIPGYSRVLRKFITWQMMKTYREDMQIWEHKEYHSRPVLCDGDGSIMKLRKWYAQFYEPTDETSAPSPTKRSTSLEVV
ncbi:MAG: Rieske 2Fe-2S domain-containing protein [Myxococcota bacterium]